MDGLGGDPETTFGELKLRLESEGHRVVILCTTGIHTHEGRVMAVIEAFGKLMSVDSRTKIFLIGFSAGGSAVRLAAAQIGKHLESKERLGGVILLSQAMPRGINYLTWPLLRTMLWRTFHLIFGLDIDSSEAEYRRLIEPVSNDRRDEVVRSRTTIPGPEARTLALWAPKFERYSYPSLVIYGSSDRWIAPRAHRKMIALLELENLIVTRYEVPNSGHLVLASRGREEVIRRIQSWIGKQ